MAFLADNIGTFVRPAAGRRAALFRERPLNTLTRWALGSVWAIKKGGVAGLGGLARVGLEELMAPDFALPDPEAALAHPPGLAGIVHDLSVETLVAAYSCGLFPFSHLPPLKWWSPPSRAVLFFEDHHFSRTIRAKMREPRYTVTFDRDFEGVIVACAGRRAGRWPLTWITPRIMRAYADLFDAGYAHSFEVWNKAGELVGGGYGVAVGASFSGESQFSLENNTSKIGLTALNYHLARWGYHFDDGKINTPTTHAMGFREIPRTDYLSRLSRAVAAPGKNGRWQVEADLPEIANWQLRPSCGH